MGTQRQLQFYGQAVSGAMDGLPEGVAHRLAEYKNLGPATFQALATAVDRLRKDGLTQLVSDTVNHIVSGAQDAALGTWLSWMQADSRGLGTSAGRVLGAGIVDVAATSVGIAVIKNAGTVAAGLNDVQAALSRAVSAEQKRTSGNVNAIAAVQPAVPRVLAGVEVHPALPDPKAGWGYMPEVIVNPRGSENWYWSHTVGFQAEIRLANEIAVGGETVVKWGQKVGVQNADVISINPTNGAVTLWDSKFRTEGRAAAESPTFANSLTRAASTNDAIAAVRDSNLSDALKQSARTALETGNFSTKTAGSGGVRNSVVVRYCNGNPC